MLPLFCSLVKVKMSFFVAWRKKDVKTPASQRCLGRKTVIKQQGSCWPRKISVELSTNEDLMQSTKAAPHFSPNFLTVSFLQVFELLRVISAGSIFQFIFLQSFFFICNSIQFRPIWRSSYELKSNFCWISTTIVTVLMSISASEFL